MRIFNKYVNPFAAASGKNKGVRPQNWTVLDLNLELKNSGTGKAEGLHFLISKETPRGQPGVLHPLAFIVILVTLSRVGPPPAPA